MRVNCMLLSVWRRQLQEESLGLSSMPCYVPPTDGFSVKRFVWWRINCILLSVWQRQLLAGDEGSLRCLATCRQLTAFVFSWLNTRIDGFSRTERYSLAASYSHSLLFILPPKQFVLLSCYRTVQAVTAELLNWDGRPNLSKGFDCFPESLGIFWCDM